MKKEAMNSAAYVRDQVWDRLEEPANAHGWDLEWDGEGGIRVSRQGWSVRVIVEPVVPNWSVHARLNRSDLAPGTRVTTWIDSSLQNGQVDKDVFPEPCTIRSVGFVVRDFPDGVVLARDNMGDGDYRGLIAIPRIAIKDEEGD